MGYALAVLVLLVVLLVVWGWAALRLSLPKLEGASPLAGLSAPVGVTRDALGIPTLTATNRADLARATGFLHAQERFFQMDLLRRAAAGELSELLGPGIVEHDLFIRRYRLRSGARETLSRARSAERDLLDAYAEGVNAGLTALRARPPEYFLLRQKPVAWRAEDSVLVLHSMALELSDPGANQEAAIAIVRKVLPEAAREFYVRRDTLTPAMLDGTKVATPRLPKPEEFDVRSGGASAGSTADPELRHFPGSNAWAVDGRRTGTGAAMLANDMHLGLGLPNVWYRAEFVWSTPDGNRHRLVGATLPGTPAMVVGSNGRVAWGFTAAQLDVSDQVLIDTDADHPEACRVGQAWQPYQVEAETITVAGASTVVLRLRLSPWGPVGTNSLGQTVAFRWAMQLPEAANFGLLQFETVSRVEELLDLAPGCGLPWLNVLAADREGHIGWTLGGRFPKRVGFDGREPRSWADGQCRWDGWFETAEMPRVVDPTNGVLWSANNPALGTETYERLRGGDLTDNGARAQQIRDRLLELSQARPGDLLAIQLDDRALFLAPWQQRLLEVFAASSNEVRFAEARPFVADWGGRAATNSVGYRVVRAFRWHVRDLLLAPVVERCRRAYPGFTYLPGEPGGVLEDLLAQRPAHLLPPPFTSYDELLAAAARAALDSLPKDRPLAQNTWGELNRVRLQHPFGKALPFLSRWLDLPARQLPGDDSMPRVQGRAFGASQRLVVSPGREPEGIFHMPGGQSGHFLSPYYGAGHGDWEEGRPSALLPGPPVHRLRLMPGS